MQGMAGRSRVYSFVNKVDLKAVGVCSRSCGEADLVEEHLNSAEMEEESGCFDGSARREDLRLPNPEKITAAYLESDHAAEEGRAVGVCSRSCGGEALR